MSLRAPTPEEKEANKRLEFSKLRPGAIFIFRLESDFTSRASFSSIDSALSLPNTRKGIALRKFTDTAWQIIELNVRNIVYISEGRECEKMILRYEELLSLQII